MDGWIDRRNICITRMDGWMDGWMVDRRKVYITHRWMDGWIDR